MANIEDVRRAPITVELDRTRELKYTLDSFACLEEKYGSIDDAFKVFEKQKFRDIIYFLWCGLTHEDESLTEKQVGKMINIRDVSKIMELVTKAVESDQAKANDIEDLVKDQSSPK